MIPPSMAVLGHAIPCYVQAAMIPRLRGIAAGVLVFVFVACGDASESGEGGAPAAPSVRIVQPAENGAAQDGSILVVLEVSGLTIAPAGTMEPGTGHHHLVVDADLPPAGSPIPATPGVHIHMGQGQTEYEITGLEAGMHTVIAVVGDGAHVPLMPWVADTVSFVVD